MYISKTELNKMQEAVLSVYKNADLEVEEVSQGIHLLDYILSDKLGTLKTR